MVIWRLQYEIRISAVCLSLHLLLGGESRKQDYTFVVLYVPCEVFSQERQRE